MERSDGTEEKETVGTAKKGKCIGKTASISAGRQTAAQTVKMCIRDRYDTGCAKGTIDLYTDW